MDAMRDLAKILIIMGAALVAVGLAMLGIQKLPFLGKLPGDILIKRENFTFYFPLATGIIISIFISLILYLVGKFK
jgi:thiosulfate reductase cytochrome b subunit